MRSIPVKQVTQQKLTVGHWNLFSLKKSHIIYLHTTNQRSLLEFNEGSFLVFGWLYRDVYCESKGPFGKCLHKHTRQFSTSNMCRADYICGISWPPWLRYEWYLLIWPTGKTLKCIREEVTLWFEPSQSNCETFSGHERALTNLSNCFFLLPVEEMAICFNRVIIFDVLTNLFRTFRHGKNVGVQESWNY